MLPSRPALLEVAMARHAAVGMIVGLCCGGLIGCAGGEGELGAGPLVAASDATGSAPPLALSFFTFTLERSSSLPN